MIRGHGVFARVDVVGWEQLIRDLFTYRARPRHLMRPWTGRTPGMR